MPTETVGPFREYYKVLVDGYVVPRLEAIPLDAQQTQWALVLDGRFSIEIDAEDLQTVPYMIANALAIGSGFSCFGENSNPANPFKREGMRLQPGDIDEDPNAQ